MKQSTIYMHHLGGQDYLVVRTSQAPYVKYNERVISCVSLIFRVLQLYIYTLSVPSLRCCTRLLSCTVILARVIYIYI